MLDTDIQTRLTEQDGLYRSRRRLVPCSLNSRPIQCGVEISLPSFTISTNPRKGMTSTHVALALGPKRPNSGPIESHLSEISRRFRLCKVSRKVEMNLGVYQRKRPLSAPGSHAVRESRSPSGCFLIQFPEYSIMGEVSSMVKL